MYQEKKSQRHSIIIHARATCLHRKVCIEKGNERGRCHLSPDFPNLKESMIRNFKKACKDRMHTSESNYVHDCLTGEDEWGVLTTTDRLNMCGAEEQSGQI